MRFLRPTHRKVREAHGKELLAEMEQQARLLNLPLPKELEAAP